MNLVVKSDDITIKVSSNRPTIAVPPPPEIKFNSVIPKVDMTVTPPRNSNLASISRLLLDEVKQTSNVPQFGPLSNQVPPKPVQNALSNQVVPKPVQNALNNQVSPKPVQN